MNTSPPQAAASVSRHPTGSWTIAASYNSQASQAALPAEACLPSASQTPSLHAPEPVWHQPDSYLPPNIAAAQAEATISAYAPQPTPGPAAPRPTAQVPGQLAASCGQIWATVPPPQPHLGMPQSAQPSFVGPMAAERLNAEWGFLHNLPQFMAPGTTTPWYVSPNGLCRYHVYGNQKGDAVVAIHGDTQDVKPLFDQVLSATPHAAAQAQGGAFWFPPGSF